MSDLRFTLISDGSFDSAALIPILRWHLIQNGVGRAIQPQWADIRYFHVPRLVQTFDLAQMSDLAQKIFFGVEYYPCELLFVHRDAEREPRANRISEIEQAIQEATAHLTVSPHACVVPVRMTEAWLLIDEIAIRHAAGNRSGQQRLDMPRISELELLPDPKQVLHGLLKTASGRTGRRLRNFEVSRHARRVTELVDDFSPLRTLTAFVALEDELRYLIADQQWNQ